MPDEEILSGDWEKFESWIKKQVGGDFIWKIKPFDKKANRQTVMESILSTIKKNEGKFPPKGDTFIELTSKKD